MKKKIGVGVCGAGLMAQTHAKIWHKNPKAKLVGFWDNPPRGGRSKAGCIRGNVGEAEAVLNPRSLKKYKTPEALFADPEIEIVDVALPTFLHTDFVCRALAAGKHVLCEKPLCVSLKKARVVVTAAAKARGFMMVAHCMRFWPEWVWLKEAVVSGKFGRPLSAVFSRRSAGPRWSAGGWMLDPKRSGGVLFDLHVHDADFIRWVFGKPAAVFAVGAGGKFSPGVEWVNVSYLYPKGGPAVSAEGAWYAEPSCGFTMRYTVIFEEATVDYDLSRRHAALLLHERKKKEPRVVKLSSGDAWERELTYFLDRVAAGNAPETATAADAAETVALCRAELKSLQTGRKVPFKKVF